MAAEIDWTELVGSGTLHSEEVKMVIEEDSLIDYVSLAFCFKNGKANDIKWTFDLTFISRDLSNSGKSQLVMFLLTLWWWQRKR